VEHFFRHEFGRLAAVLTRSLGVRRLDLVEDVQSKSIPPSREALRGIVEPNLPRNAEFV
jgi:hypothetical protein